MEHRESSQQGWVPTHSPMTLARWPHPRMGRKRMIDEETREKNRNGEGEEYLLLPISCCNSCLHTGVMPASQQMYLTAICKPALCTCPLEPRGAPAYCVCLVARFLYTQSGHGSLATLPGLACSGYDWIGWGISLPMHDHFPTCSYISLALTLSLMWRPIHNVARLSNLHWVGFWRCRAGVVIARAISMRNYMYRGSRK